PMGFYSSATLVKDAQRHGLKVKSVDVLNSEWLCTLEAENRNPTDPPTAQVCAPSTAASRIALRLGFRCVRSLRESAALALVRERTIRAFHSVEDLAARVPELSKSYLVMLARIGASNSLQEGSHRRDALWQVGRAVRPAGPLFQETS